jgi:predicted hotdog family 3-hydroxylacyl-ACP dehydratase
MAVRRLRSAVCGLPSAVHIRLFVPHSLTVCLLDRLESLSYGGSPSASAVCGLPSAVHIRLFVPHSLTVCLLDRLESLSYGGPPSALRGLRSAVRRPYSFIRFPIR